MNFKKSINNVFFGLSTQLILMIFGFILPRLMISGYGSEVNGLFSTINNIYMYLALVVAGISTSAIQALYKPIVEKNHDKINQILATTRKYFYQCTIVYLIGVIIITILLPVVLNSSIKDWQIAAIVFIEGVTGAFNFIFLAGVISLLTAEGKNYVVSNITFIGTVITYLVKIILVNLHVNIVILQLSYFCVSILSILIYRWYFNQKYKWISKKVKPEHGILKQRYSILIHQIVYLVFNNTDVVLLSIFCGLKVTSVYSIYNMIFIYLFKVINSIFNGIKFNLGQTYNKSIDQYIILHDTYKSIYCAFVFSIFSITYILLLPFINLYTSGIVDINYYDNYLPFLFCMVNLLSSCRQLENNLITIAYHAKQTLVRAIVEALLNLVVSIILIQKIGIYGCLFGTIVALLYRTNEIIIYCNKKILHRKPMQSYLTLLANFTLFGLIVFLSPLISINISSYWSFIKWGAILSPIIILCYFSLNFLVNIKGYKFIKNIIRYNLGVPKSLKV